MTARDDLHLVVELACVTGDRTPAEQRALLNVAMKVELDLNAGTSRNLRQRGRDAIPSRLVDLVESTYEPEGRAVSLSVKDRDRVERQRARFVEDHALAWSDGRGYGARWGAA